MRSACIKVIRSAVLLVIIGVAAVARAQGLDPLPSWNDGAAKKSVTDFVARVTTPGGADFVAPELRIATFDNDGTLWAEQPVYFQLAFAIDRVKALASRDPELRKRISSRPCSREIARRWPQAARKASRRSWPSPMRA